MNFFKKLTIARLIITLYGLQVSISLVSLEGSSYWESTVCTVYVQFFLSFIFQTAYQTSADFRYTFSVA